jgi:hypothetical protein
MEHPVHVPAPAPAPASDSAADAQQQQQRLVSSEDPPLLDADACMLIQINIHGNFTHSSTRVKVTPSLTAGAVIHMVSEKNGISVDHQNFFTLVAVYIQDIPKSLTLIRTLKSSDIILNVIKEKESKTPATREAMHTTKW